MVEPMISTVLLLSLSSLFPPDSLPEGWEIGLHPLLFSEVVATWSDEEPHMDSWKVDFSVALSLRSDVFDLGATGALRRDSVPDVSLRRASASVRWPGSPWIGTRAGLRDVQPFVCGMDTPVIDWGWMEIDSIHGFGVSAGGILGFSGEISLLTGTPGDTLIWTDVRAPWLGFGTVRWSGFRRDQSPYAGRIDVVTAMADFRYVKPWVSVVDCDAPNSWGVAGELRGWKPLTTSFGEIEIVPGLAFAGDSIALPGDAFESGQRLLSLDLFHTSKEFFFGAFLSGRIDLEGKVPDGVMLGMDMISRAGIEYALRAGFSEPDDWSARLDADYRRVQAGGGLSVAASSDSVRVFGRASYNPLSSVSTLMEVSADIFDETLDPMGTLRVFIGTENIWGSIALEWDGENVVFLIDTRGYLW